MKPVKAILLSCLLATFSLQAGDINKADKRWAEVVERMIEKGERDFSTPIKQRANLAQELAKKHGFESKIVRCDKGYRIHLTASTSLE